MTDPVHKLLGDRIDQVDKKVSELSGRIDTGFESIRAEVHAMKSEQERERDRAAIRLEERQKARAEAGLPPLDPDTGEVTLTDKPAAGKPKWNEHAKAAVELLGGPKLVGRGVFAAVIAWILGDPAADAWRATLSAPIPPVVNVDTPAPSVYVPLDVGVDTDPPPGAPEPAP